MNNKLNKNYKNNKEDDKIDVCLFFKNSRNWLVSIKTYMK